MLEEFNPNHLKIYLEIMIIYGTAITYAVVILLLLCGFAYLTFKITSKKMIGSLPKLIALLMVLLLVGSTFVGGIIYFIR